jgi:proteasome alpha subunit
MYEEPYRWVEAVGNRRQYLDEQFKQGSPVVALSYADGVLMLTLSKGTPKLYEIYDRIGLGGMGHPADLEKLRFGLLEMAHLEGFNRSPSDVTGARLMKYGLAPSIKQAFEEIYKAPWIVKILLAEMGAKSGKDAFLTINYDGTFEETIDCAVLAATASIQKMMQTELKQAGASGTLPLARALESALRVWGLGSLAQSRAVDDDRSGDRQDRDRAAEPDMMAGTTKTESEADPAAVTSHLREQMADRTVECAVLERQVPGSSKYRAIKQDELACLLPSGLAPSTA